EIDLVAQGDAWIRVDAEGFSPVITSARRGHGTAGAARRIELPRAARLEIVLRYDGDRPALRVKLQADGEEILQDEPFTSPPLPIPDLKYTAPGDETGPVRVRALR